MNDVGEFLAAVDRYDARLRTVVYGVISDPHELDDIMQDVYRKAFVASRTFERRSEVGTWLHRIAVNTALDSAKSRARVVPLTQELLDTRLEPRRSGERNVSLEVGNVLASLPPEQRAAVLLVDYEGYTYAEAAQLCGFAPGTLAKRVVLARRKIRRAFGLPVDTSLSKASTAEEEQ